MKRELDIGGAKNHKLRRAVDTRQACHTAGVSTAVTGTPGGTANRKAGTQATAIRTWARASSRRLPPGTERLQLPTELDVLPSDRLQLPVQGG